MQGESFSMAVRIVERTELEKSVIIVFAVVTLHIKELIVCMYVHFRLNRSYLTDCPIHQPSNSNRPPAR